MSEHPDWGDQTQRPHDFHDFKPTFARLDALEARVAELELEVKHLHAVVNLDGEIQEKAAKRIIELESRLAALEAKLELAVLEGPD